MRINKAMKNINTNRLMNQLSRRPADLKAIAESLGRGEEYPLDLAIALVENLEADCGTILYVLNHVEKKEVRTMPKQIKSDETLSLHEHLMVIQSQLKAPKNQKNTFGGYNYRSCEDILEAVKPYLGGLTLTLTDAVENIGDRYYVKATAILSDGTDKLMTCAYAREDADKKGMAESQVTGMASSYARKYALNGLFLIDDTKDADTMDNREEKPGRQPKPKAEAESDFPASERKLMSEAVEEADWMDKPIRKTQEVTRACATCGRPATLRHGVSQKTGKPWSAFFCESGQKSHTKFTS